MFYHSHVAFQRGDGLFGPYIVRAIKDTDPNSKEYDFDLTEHFISVQEWFHQVSFTEIIQSIFNQFFFAIEIYILSIRSNFLSLGNKRGICIASLGSW